MLLGVGSYGVREVEFNKMLNTNLSMHMDIK